MTVFTRRLSAVSLMMAAVWGAQVTHAADATAGANATTIAQPQAMVEGKGIAITKQDVQADAQRIPPDVRPLILARPQNVRKMASDLYVLRSMGQMGLQLGMDRDPKVAAALQVARDKVLAEAWLAALDEKNMPSVEAAEKKARSVYLAQPERFQAGEQVRARHILISSKDADARTQAEQLLDEIKKGADFAVLAKERSADTGSAARGGDLGFFERGRMVPEFEQAAFALKKPGELSGVVESKFGFHIIQLEALRPAGLKPFEEVRDDLIKTIRSSVAQDARVTAADEIRKGLVTNEAVVDAFVSENTPKP